MSILGHEFIYDGINSVSYGLTILNVYETPTKQISGTLTYETEGYNNGVHNIIKKASYEPYSFVIEIISEKIITEEKLTEINCWLFNRLQYKKLFILSHEYTNIYYNCILSNPEKYDFCGKDGFGCYGFKATVLCENPWAYEGPYTLTYSAETLASTFIFINHSEDPGYLYPEIKLDVGATSGDIKIKNISDNEREVIITDLSDGIENYSGESLYIDSRKCTIESSLDRNVYGHLYLKRFPRFIPGENKLSVTGDVSNLSITYKKARRVGI